MSDLNKIFDAWLDTGELSQSNEKLLQQDPAFSQMYKNARQWHSQEMDYQETQVPKWHKEQTFFEKPSAKGTGFNWNWLNSAMLAMSFFLCTLVVTQAQLDISNEGISVTFNQEDKQALEFNELKHMLSQIQKDNSQQAWKMAQQAIDTGRIERREDINTLITYLKEQRNQDQTLIKLQLNDLAEQVENQELTAVAKNTILEQ
jgi:hypothetical protein